ncbi:MAG TPA: hypothetical protein DEF41_07175 [Desulfovibrio sp.]|uniref:Uncharacterized protein n=2 Tax=Nitratidesulfovibrio vulgaris TaxID=881 RepID=Q72C10_NITV2|nr:hypothetical protein DVU_1474 [Nitratidesulfovibrio vulgaris str. Hildenborough]HBW15906.1 hypothetical protein [Desulfovibrio sp.]
MFTTCGIRDKVYTRCTMGLVKKTTTCLYGELWLGELD